MGLFTAEWMGKFMTEWNAESDLADALAKIDFKSTIGYGFQGDDKPVGVLVVEGGQAVAAGAYNGEALNWDIRCSEDHWNSWIAKPPGMMKLGLAFTSGKMKFNEGDYAAMLKDPRMAGPFIKSFSVMGKV